MLALRVKAEFLPTRCEICHLTDQFDPVMAECSRCRNLHFLIGYSNSRTKVGYREPIIKLSLITLDLLNSICLLFFLPITFLCILNTSEIKLFFINTLYTYTDHINSTSGFFDYLIIS